MSHTRYELPYFPAPLKLLQHIGALSPTSPGVFVFSPVILRAIEKLCTFIDYKMAEVGGQKCIFPTLGSSQLWSQSGRWDKFGGEMFRLSDRTGKSFCLQPTHEEEVCSFVSGLGIGSNALPLRVYQISSKFRDEIQPKLGLLRCREFLMQADMYSFDLDVEHAKETYKTLSNVYSEILSSLHLPFYRVEAEGGLMGDCPSDEFHCPLAVGEDSLVVCQNCKKAVLATHSVGSMTCPQCGSDRQLIKSVEVAHCFLLGNTYTSSFNVRASTQGGYKTLQMGCYGIGVTRLLATALEHFTTTLTNETPPSELRWPPGFAPFSGAIALQKDNAKDALSPDELSLLLARFNESPPANPSTSSFFSGLLPRGDILIDDRPRLSLGRKLVDLRQLGVPWILIAKSHKADAKSSYELVDVTRGVSSSASLEEALSAFTHSDFRPSLHDGSRLWHRTDTRSH
ncbi:unnamed protein product [Mesocestoides corti]|uniref:proline--tRNA ligase n=1 Tax=Mesocestoides corti TaxID=53468 RepID=A0A3P6HQ13_MESCO|nr:unnamed protein product [Mesocestoides corti]